MQCTHSNLGASDRKMYAFTGVSVYRHGRSRLWGVAIRSPTAANIRLRFRSLAARSSIPLVELVFCSSTRTSSPPSTS